MSFTYSSTTKYSAVPGTQEVWHFHLKTSAAGLGAEVVGAGVVGFPVVGDAVYGVTSVVGKGLKKLAYAVEAWRQRRATYGELVALDDRLLADIGIHRSDIPAIAEAAGHQHIVGGRVAAPGSLTSSI